MSARHRRASSVTVGAVAAVVLVIVAALAWFGLPFRGGYELKAVFSTSQSIALSSPDASELPMDRAPSHASREGTPGGLIEPTALPPSTNLRAGP